jgi:hypothetical protein
MRNQAHSLMSLVMVAGVAAAGFIGACGGKVVVEGSNPSGAGGAGGGLVATSGPQTTSGPISTGSITTGPITGPATVGATTGGPITTGSTMDVAVSVGPGPGASSSTGGLNTCDIACDKASACGFDFCSQFNINCANPPQQAACPLNCIANGSCGDIAKLAMQNFATPLGFCLLGCQNMGPSAVSSSAVGTTGSGPPPMACQQCTLQQCGGPIFQCNAKKGAGSCSQWLQCAQGCAQDSMCLFGCDSQFPNAAPQYLPVYDCLCNNCDAACPAEDACSHNGVAPSGAAVGSVGSGGVGGAGP